MFFWMKKKRIETSAGKYSQKSRKKIWHRIIGSALCIALIGTNMGGALTVEAAINDQTSVVADTGEDDANLLSDVDAFGETEQETGSVVETPVQNETESIETESVENVSSGTEDSGNLEDVSGESDKETEELESKEPSQTEACKHHPVHDEACGYTEENPVCTFVCAVCPVQNQIDDLLLQMEQWQMDELDEASMEQIYAQVRTVFEAYQALKPEEQEQIAGAEYLTAMMEQLETQLLADGDATMEIETALIRDAEGNEQSLLSDGTFTVDYSRQVTLHIVVKSTLNLQNKKVEITVPDGLTVVEYPIPERGGMAESVTPESIDQLNSSNNYGGYCPKSGTITYSLKSTAQENSFNIILEPDTVLWNRRKEQPLSQPLNIRVYTGDVGDTANQTPYQTVSANAKITGSYDATRAIQTGPRLSSVGVKTGVPTAAGQPFALRQVWLNPDKDYIDMPQFFKELEITIALPYYEKDGSNVYAEFDHITYDPAGMSTRANLLNPENHKDENDNYLNGFNFTETRNDTDHTVTLKWTNLYLEYGQDYFTPYFKWTSDCDVTTNKAVKWGSGSILSTGNTAPGCFEGKEPTTGAAAAAVGGKITWQDDSMWYPWNNPFNTLSFTAYEGESMSVTGKANDNPIYNNYTSDPNIIYYLGQFHVVNHGGDKSAEKTVEFTYAINDKIGVTAQKIPANDGNVVEVWYTTNQNTNEQKYDGTLISSGGFVTFTAQMAGLGENDYFTKIRANVGGFEKDYVGYVASRAQDPTSGYATTFGKLLTADAGTYNDFAFMNMYDTDSNVSTATTAKYTVKVTSTGGEIPLAMEQAYKENSLERLPILSDPETGESKTAATAGDTITFNGLLSSSAYPYSSNNITTDQEIYIRLPEKITVKNLKLYQEVGRMADKVFLFDVVTETELNPTREEISDGAYNLEEVTSTATAYKLYKITFTNLGNPVKVGWFTDGLGQYQIGISFDMEIARDADAMTLDMRDCVRFKSASLESTSNTGTLSQYQVVDTYDMDGDNNMTERFSTFNVNAKGSKLSVVAARLGLTFTFGARMVDLSQTPDYNPGDYSNYEVDGKKVFLTDENHGVDMLFTLKNETGRDFTEAEAKAFYYFIPVPKAGDFWDSHMQDEAFDFDMKLTGEPTLSGESRDRISVKYSTTIDSKAASGNQLHYSNPDNYVEASEITDWSQVKMIRIAAKDNVTSIRQDAELQVCLHYVPAFKSNAELVGSTVNFGPCGVSPYSVGNTTNQGHNPLPRIQVEFQTGIIEGKVFLDKNFNGTYDETVDELYKGEVGIYAPHWNNVEDTEITPGGDTDSHRTTTMDGNYKFTGRMADLYHVIVTNPGNPDRASDKPLKFSLPQIGSKFTASSDSKTVTASVTLKKGDGSAVLDIGLQQPHSVRFVAANAALGSGSVTAFAADAEYSVNVWHNDQLNDDVPSVTADSGYKFTDNWSDGTSTYTTEQLKNTTITKDKTFTAEVKQLYSVRYDGNGNTEGAVPETSMHIEGEKVTPVYTGTEALKKDAAIFAGWSLEQITTVLQADAAQETIAKIITNDEHEMPDHDVTLYAVWAVDANYNGKPDYNDDAVHVRYHGNNNDRRDVICSHHHVTGSKAALSTSGEVYGKMLNHDAPASDADNEIKPHTFTYGTNIFVGWSTTPILDKIIVTPEDYQNLKSSIHTEVKMLDKAGADVSNIDASDTSKYADADGNTNVYAVWAQDRNGNKTADYLESYGLTYAGNARDSGTINNLPSDNTIYIPQDEVNLSTQVPTHSDVDGKKVVFICWTSAAVEDVFERSDNVPVNKITKVTFVDADVTVYAAWGYDENGNGIADVLETYTLTYDLNGGEGTIPAQVTGIEKRSTVKLTEEKSFTRSDKALFAGWSTTQHSAAFTAGEKDDIENILIKKESNSIVFGTEDITLYAVWAEDRNGNGTADYDEVRRITYDGNACEGTVESSTVPVDKNAYIPTDKLTLSEQKPLHASVDGKNVVFIGWTPKAVNKILGREDEEPATVTEVTFTDGDITVYAVWGYDENGNDMADVLETYSLSYDLNGGNGTVPAEGTDIKKGEIVTLTKDKDFTRGDKELFVGWSRTKCENAFTAGQENDMQKILITGTQITLETENIILYAVWAEDRNGNGTADYMETVKVLYDGNGKKGGTVSGIPIDNGVHIPEDKVTLSEDVPTYSEADDKQVVFLGWTAQATDQIYSRSDTAPETIREVTLGKKDVTVYAAWGYDENGNSMADVLETYSLSYDLNGGKGTVPKGESNIEKNQSITLTQETDFTRKDKEVFVGWSRTKCENAFTAGQENDMQKILITGTQITLETENIILYAVWAEDRNGNGTADYMETVKVLYDGNGKKGGTVSGIPADDGVHISGDKVTLSIQKPIHSDVDGKKVVFLGWTAQATDQIYSRDDKTPEYISEVMLGDRDITVYAVWGYNEDGDEKEYTVTYDLNDGIPAENELYGPETVKNGAVHTVKAAPSRGDHIFAGWKDENGEMHQPGEKVTVDGDLNLIAQWRSLNGDNPDAEKPNKPIGPGGSTNSNPPTNHTDAMPRTGDETDLVPWIILMGCSCFTVISILVVFILQGKRKKHKNR